MTPKQFISIIINNCLLFKGDDFDKNMGIILWMAIVGFLSFVGILWILIN